MALALAQVLHIVAAVFAIIELGLTAYWASLYNGFWGYGTYSPPSINFMIFASVWSLLVLIYLAFSPLFMPSIFRRQAAFSLIVVTDIFWFAGSIAIAVLFGPPYVCGSQTACSTAQAAITFGFLLWALFSILAIMDGTEVLRRHGHSVATSKSTDAYPGA